MITLKHETIYTNSIAYFAMLFAHNNSRRVRVLLPGAQYQVQFAAILANRGFSIRFQDVDYDYRF